MLISFFIPGIEGTTRPEANPYGPPVAPEEAPEAITQAVASLPPEQMFELMKQMKVKKKTVMRCGCICKLQIL